MTKPDDARFMALALSLGARGLGRVAPWPSVGCVIVRDGRIVGRGVSDRVSGRHAERVALDQAGDAARGATAYVTLEPCSHHGSTPPCSDALIDAGIARVVVAQSDPNPLVDGAGIERLRAAGIAVETGLMEREARKLHAGFLSVIRKGRPWVTLKLAASLDGRIATITGESKWITGPLSRRRVHAMRASHDAVMVGGGTARQDDPRLDVRELGAGHQPAGIVWSGDLNLSPDGNLVRRAGDVPLWLVHGEGLGPEVITRWQASGARLLAVPFNDPGQLDLLKGLKLLAEAGLTRILCEGGAALAASLLKANLVDELVVFSAGKIIGAEGQAMVGDVGLTALAAAPSMQLVKSEVLDGDVITTWAPKISD